MRHANNRKIWRNLTEMFPHPYTDADADNWIGIASQPGAGTHVAIELDREAIGGIGVIAREGISCRTGHFGYWLGEAHWGEVSPRPPPARWSRTCLPNPISRGSKHRCLRGIRPRCGYWKKRDLCERVF